MIPSQLSQLHYHLGLNNIKESNISQAIDELKRSLILDNENPNYLNLLGLCYYQLGDFNSASETWKNSLHNDPSNERTKYYLSKVKKSNLSQYFYYYNKSIDLLKLQKYDEAEKTLRKCDSFKPFNASQNNLLGLIHYCKGEINNSIEIWNKTLKIDKGNKRALYYVNETKNLTHSEHFKFKVTAKLNSIKSIIKSRFRLRKGYD